MYKEQPIPTRPSFRDLTGKRFGRWMILCYVGRHKNQTYWRCECDCGTVKDVQHGNLAAGQSSGCEKCREYGGRRTHGMSGTKEYHLWKSLKDKGRLVKRWHDFSALYKVVGDKPEGMTLKPIDDKRLIGPDNWRWGKPEYEMPEEIKKQLLHTQNRQEAIINARKAGATLQAIGEVLGLTRERVRQLEAYGKEFELWRPGERRGAHKKTRERDAAIIKCYNQGMTVDQMAAALGLNRYAIKRGLGYLRDDGLIDYRVDMSNRKKRTPPVTKKRGNAN